jgi:DNA-binding NtrC family response regulator
MSASPSNEPWIAMTTWKALVVDDQPAVRTAISLLLEVHDLPCAVAATPAEALEMIASDAIGVVVQDMNYAGDTTSGREGVELFRAIRKLDPEMPVVLMTAWTSLETAVELVKNGAADYIAKPWDDARLLATVRMWLSRRTEQQESRRVLARRARDREELAGRVDLAGLVYASDEMHAVVRLAVTVANADVPVLVLGPNGAGKERIAEIIHRNSRRRDRPLVRVNAGSLPDTLIEAELFGAEAGAFTGATKTRVGRFEAADGGTLFLDEIGNLSPSGQMKLLRVLQTGEFERLGSSVTRRVNVRVVSATNADLPRMIREGTFREDLYFRLNVVEVAIPPLCDRPDDVLPLAEHFLRMHAESAGRPALKLAAAGRAALVAYAFPGNVRELGNRVQRATVVAAGDEITAEDLGLTGEPRRAPDPAERPSRTSGPPREADAEEHKRIEAALTQANGVVSLAATALGMSRQALYRRMERVGLSIERRPRGE